MSLSSLISATQRWYQGLPQGQQIQFLVGCMLFGVAFFMALGHVRASASGLQASIASGVSVASVVSSNANAAITTGQQTVNTATNAVMTTATIVNTATTAANNTAAAGTAALNNTINTTAAPVTNTINAGLGAVNTVTGAATSAVGGVAAALSGITGAASGVAVAANSATTGAAVVAASPSIYAPNLGATIQQQSKQIVANTPDITAAKAQLNTDLSKAFDPGVLAKQAEAAGKGIGQAKLKNIADSATAVIPKGIGVDPSALAAKVSSIDTAGIAQSIQAPAAMVGSLSGAVKGIPAVAGLSVGGINPLDPNSLNSGNLTNMAQDAATNAATNYVNEQANKVLSPVTNAVSAVNGVVAAGQNVVATATATVQGVGNAVGQTAATVQNTSSSLQQTASVSAGFTTGQTTNSTSATSGG